MSTVCGFTFNKESIQRLAFGGLGILICAICTVLFINSFLLPILTFGDYQQVSTCSINTTSINVKCFDYWEASCSVTVQVNFQDDSGNTISRIARYPQIEGIPKYRANEFADTIKVFSTQSCYYSPERDSAEATFENPMPSATGYVVFGAAGLLAIGGLIFAFFCGCTGFSEARKEYSTVGKYSSADKTSTYTAKNNDGLMATTANDFMSNTRNRFIAKVYGILTVQLIITFGIIIFTLLVDAAREFCQTNWWLMLVGLGIAIVLLIPLIFLKNKHPVNLILLFLFTIGFALAIAITCTYYGVTIVFQAGITTVVIFLSLTIFCVQTRFDFSFLGAGLYCALMGMIAFSLLSIFFPVTGFTQVIYGFCGVILFSFYILYDTTLLLEKYEETEHIMAAVNLYLDIMNIFLYLLYIFGGAKK